MMYALVLTGDTFHHRQEIQARGFTWHPKEKAWFRSKLDLDVLEEVEIRKWVRRLGGVTLTEEFAHKYPAPWRVRG